MVASESCIKGLGFDKGPCVTNLIVLNHSDWAIIGFFHFLVVVSSYIYEAPTPNYSLTVKIERHIKHL